MKHSYVLSNTPTLSLTTLFSLLPPYVPIPIRIKKNLAPKPSQYAKKNESREYCWQQREVTTVTTRAGSSSGCLASLTLWDQCRGHRSLLVREAGHPSSSPELIPGLAVDFYPRNHKTPLWWDSQQKKSHQEFFHWLSHQRGVLWLRG